MKESKRIFKKMWNQHKLVRFLFVGSFNTFLDFILLNLLFELAGLQALLANTISVLAGITISYFLNHRIVFRHPYKHSLKSYAQFLLVTGLSVLIIQNLIIYLVTKLVVIHNDSSVHIAYVTISDEVLELNAAKALAVLTALFWNYLLYKHVVFRNHKAEYTDEIVVG